MSCVIVVLYSCSHCVTTHVLNVFVSCVMAVLCCFSFRVFMLLLSLYPVSLLSCVFDVYYFVSGPVFQVGGLTRTRKREPTRGVRGHSPGKI